MQSKVTLKLFVRFLQIAFYLLCFYSVRSFEALGISQSVFWLLCAAVVACYGTYQALSATSDEFFIIGLIRLLAKVSVGYVLLLNAAIWLPSFARKLNRQFVFTSLREGA